MKRTFQVAILALILTTFFATSALLVSADASVSTINLACDHLTASGSSDSPYATLYVYNYDTDEEYFTVVPVSGGTFSGTLSFPAAPNGTLFDVQVWGSLNTYSDFNDPDYYDYGDYYDADTNCTQGKTDACTYPLPADAVLYDVPLGAPAYFAADLQSATGFNLPAGTWKISETSGDFSKVWIACQATPIWIPTSAVGGAVG